jgi:hypothetical protein
VVDYRKVNSDIVSFSYPLPTTEQTSEQFGGAVVFKFSALSIPLSVLKSSGDCLMHATRPFELIKLPIGFSVGCRRLSRVVYDLYAD